MLNWKLASLQQSETNRTFARELELSMFGYFSATGCTEHIFGSTVPVNYFLFAS